MSDPFVSAATRTAYRHAQAVVFLVLLTWGMLGTRLFAALLVLLTVVLAARSVRRRRADTRARAVSQWERDHPLPTQAEARAIIRRFDPGYGELLDLVMPLSEPRPPAGGFSRLPGVLVLPAGVEYVPLPPAGPSGVSGGHAGEVGVERNPA